MLGRPDGPGGPVGSFPCDAILYKRGGRIGRFGQKGHVNTEDLQKLAATLFDWQGNEVVS